MLSHKNGRGSELTHVGWIYYLFFSLICNLTQIWISHPINTTPACKCLPGLNKFSMFSLNYGSKSPKPLKYSNTSQQLNIYPLLRFSVFCEVLEECFYIFSLQAIPVNLIFCSCGLNTHKCRKFLRVNGENYTASLL